MAYAACQIRIKELEQKVAMLGRQSTKKAETGIAKHDQEVMMHAKKFTVLHELFIPPSDSFFAQPKPAVDLWSRDRYKDEASRMKAILGELYFVLPEHLHSFVSGHSKFNTDVSPGFHIAYKWLLIVFVFVSGPVPSLFQKYAKPTCRSHASCCTTSLQSSSGVLQS
jgi:hypothetical protein